MKKIAPLIAAVATVFGTPAHAQTTGRAATAGKQAANDSFQWGIALIGIAVLGTIVGLTASTASANQNSYSN